MRPMLSQRWSVSYLLAISDRGLLRFLLLKKAIDAPALITFLERLCQDAGQKVYLILDNLKVHKAREVWEWVEAHADQIALFYLPPYSLELNPDEYLNGDLKAQVTRCAPSLDRDTLERSATSRLCSLQRHPKAVKRFFHHPHVRCVA